MGSAWLQSMLMQGVLQSKTLCKSAQEIAAIWMAGDNSSRNMISMQANLQEPELCAGNESLILID